ncbi:MAG: Csu type fimbrial protein [Acetobacteraceae bacterium]
MSLRRKRFSRLLLAAVGLMLACAVSARAQLACTVSTTGLAFGRYVSASRVPDDASGSISVSCTAATPTTLAYSIGLFATKGASSAPVMRSASGRLGYQLYADPARTEVWGDGASGRTVSFAAGLPAGRSNVQRFTVYGRIPPGQSVPPGSYQDQVVITLSY